MNDQENKNADHAAGIVAQAASTAAATVAQAATVAAALVANDISYIKKDIIEIKGLIKDIQTLYVTRSEYSEVTTELKDHETRLRSIKSFQDNLMGRMWAIGTVASLVSGSFVVIISHYWR